MPKLRREYTLRVLKNAEPTFPNLYSNEQLFTNFYYAFFQIFDYFPIFSGAFLKKLKAISFSIFKI